MISREALGILWTIADDSIAGMGGALGIDQFDGLGIRTARAQAPAQPCFPGSGRPMDQQMQQVPLIVSGRESPTIFPKQKSIIGFAQGITSQKLPLSPVSLHHKFQAPTLSFSLTIYWEMAFLAYFCRRRNFGFQAFPVCAATLARSSSMAGFPRIWNWLPSFEENAEWLEVELPSISKEVTTEGILGNIFQWQFLRNQGFSKAFIRKYETFSFYSFLSCCISRIIRQKTLNLKLMLILCCCSSLSLNLRPKM